MQHPARFAGAFALALLAAVSVAQEEEGLSGKVALGYLATSGNSDSENMNLNFSGDYHAEVWHHNLTGSAVRASTSGITTSSTRRSGRCWPISSSAPMPSWSQRTS